MSSYRKTLVFGVVAVAMQLAATGVAHAYGALAIDGNKGSRYGWAVNYKSSGDAARRALRECGRGCYVAMTFARGCAAYAADQSRGSTVYGWARGSQGSSVRQRALRECQSRGGRRCVVRAWGCNSR